MKVYIIEYKSYDPEVENYRHKISQEGYKSIQEAQDFIEGRSGTTQVSPMHYICGTFDHYYIHEILIKE